MTTQIKRVLLGAITGTALFMAGCSGEAEAPAETEAVVPGIEVTNARLVLPPVAGNPAAVYFDVVYNGERALAITGASVEGAKDAMLHTVTRYNLKDTMVESLPVSLKNGEPVTFEPGALHIMANELEAGVESGGTVEVTLDIAGGDKHAFTAEVRAAGEER